MATKDRQIEEMLQTTVEAMGFGLWGVEYLSQGRRSVLRVYIDRDAGVTVEDCERVSKQISALLDVEEPIGGSYTLEVSSPGLDRKLTKVEHFQRFEGETLKVSMRFPIEGRRRFRGKLMSSNAENIVVEVDGESHSLPLSMIDTARLVPEGT